MTHVHLVVGRVWRVLRSSTCDGVKSDKCGPVMNLACSIYRIDIR
jgi:hypothetical protein